MPVGIGDDAAVVEPERNRLEVLSVDALVEGVHFDRRFTPPDAIGHRALAVNLSDLAAMGAAPRLALLSLALPPVLLCDDFDALISGLAALAVRHRIHVAGGNLTRSPGPLLLDITVLGTAKRRQVLTRSGARPGDEIYVSGTIGAAAAGLEVLKKRGLSTTEETEDTEPKSFSEQASPSVSSASSVVERSSMVERSSVVEHCVRRYLYPEPRVRLGMLLGRNRAATACVDLSDGLADAVQQISNASGVGARIDADALPIDPGVRTVFASSDPVVEAISRGDDYELLFTVRPRLRSRLTAAGRHGDVRLTRIGVCTDTRELILRRPDREEALPPGYRHFR